MFISSSLLTEYVHKCRADGQGEETAKVTYRNLRIFVDFCANKELNANLLSDWRRYLAERYTSPYTRNAMVSKTNTFLDYLGLFELRVKSFAVEYHKLHSKSKYGVTLDELKKMLKYTEETKNFRVNLLLRVLAITGIRSGEIQYITVEAVNAGFSGFIHYKKPRNVLLPNSLCKHLTDYAKSQGITTGPIFITKQGNPMHQRNIGTDLKRIAVKVDIPKDKINPTAFRILFANTYYEKYGDLSGLTDLLGVKDLNMTVLYVKKEC